MGATAVRICNWASLRVSYFFLIAAAYVAIAANSAYAQPTSGGAVTGLSSQDVQIQRSLQMGFFVTGGFVPFYELHGRGLRYYEELDLFNAGFEAGKMITLLHGSSFLRGRGEAVVEVIPFWLAHYPKQQLLIHESNGFLEGSSGGGFSNHGVSVTPLLFRWNFVKQGSSHFVPWVQLGSGLLWTAR